tara:strand:+ start:322 stop:675 length:354 start_codon:yes stop_codon:yes gene_type:complete
MEFIKTITENKNNYGLSIIDAIEVGVYRLSIQASKLHYCSPRENLDLNLYTSMELGLWKTKDNTESIILGEDKNLLAFPRFDELKKYIETTLDTGFAVFGYVPVDLLNDLYLYLKNI